MDIDMNIYLNIAISYYNIYYTYSYYIYAFIWYEHKARLTSMSKTEVLLVLFDWFVSSTTFGSWSTELKPHPGHCFGRLHLDWRVEGTPIFKHTVVAKSSGVVVAVALRDSKNSTRN